MVNRMASIALPGNVPWYRRHAVRWVAMSRLSNRKLRLLYLAVFSLFAIFGPYLNIQSVNPLPFSLVVLTGVVSGLYSVLYPWVLIRKPWSLTIPVGIFHAFLGALSLGILYTGSPRCFHSCRSAFPPTDCSPRTWSG